jgi:hypothetical protein
MPGGVAQRFLDDAEQCERCAVGQIASALIDIARDRNAEVVPNSSQSRKVWRAST